MINASLPRNSKPPLHASNSSPTFPVEDHVKPEPQAPVRRSKLYLRKLVLYCNFYVTKFLASAPFLQKTGYLHKRGGKRQNWKERYFVLTPGMFTYYKNDVVCLGCNIHTHTHTCSI